MAQDPNINFSTPSAFHSTGPAFPNMQPFNYPSNAIPAPNKQPEPHTQPAFQHNVANYKNNTENSLNLSGHRPPNYTASPVLRPPHINHVQNNDSSLNSSRNSSPAQSGMSNSPIPQHTNAHPPTINQFSQPQPPKAQISHLGIGGVAPISLPQQPPISAAPQYVHQFVNAPSQFRPPNPMSAQSPIVNPSNQFRPPNIMTSQASINPANQLRPMNPMNSPIINPMNQFRPSNSMNTQVSPIINNNLNAHQTMPPPSMTMLGNPPVSAPFNPNLPPSSSSQFPNNLPQQHPIAPPPMTGYGNNNASVPAYQTNASLPPQFNSYPATQPPMQQPMNRPNIAPQPVLAPGPQTNFNQYTYPNAQPQANHYNGQQDLSQQMGRLSVTQSGMNKLWGNETVDLLQCRNILPEGKLEPPAIRLNQHFANSVNCHPDIFRCTLNRIPETNNLLQKSRLPLGILIHPFKDLSHLPVIQCNAIVRCRSCRTYINPFVYFIDLKRWKCNLCYRVNDLPEEFQYDPLTKSYGDPTRRPEIQSATIEYIAPSEYMLRPPQPAAYLFLLDVSASAADSGYLKLFCETLTEQIDNLPGDSRTQLAFICYDSAIHFYFLGENASRPKEMTVIDIDDVFLPSPDDLLVNLAERRSSILELLAALPNRFANPSPAATQSALGAALQAALKLMSPTGGRVAVFQTCLPNVGPGALTPREDPNNRSSKEVAHLNPATDFYKREALNCSGVQVAVDLFVLNSQYADLSTISGISRFSGGAVYHFPLFKSSREYQYQELKRCLIRYLTRKIGFEAVMRVRCTRGLSIHAFHGSFFVRSTDLLSLPNISPDAGFGMQLAIEESLADVQHVCFQAALLYTSSKGERRIRVHTLCLPVTSTLSDVIHSADQQCIIGLLAKMAVDRSQAASLSDAREALINAAVDALGTVKIVTGPTHGLMCPMALRLLPLYLLALLKYKAFRTGTSTRLDDRLAAMCNMKSLPLPSLIRFVYPDLYPVHRLSDYVHPIMSNDGEHETDEISIPDPPRLRLSAEKVSATGAYLLDQEDTMVLYIGHTVHPNWLHNTLGVDQHSQIIDDGHSIPTLETEENTLLHGFIDHLNDEKPYTATLHIIRDNSPNRSLFIDKLVDDRVESALSYYEFLQHIKTQMK